MVARPPDGHPKEITRWVRSPEVLWREVLTGVVILPLHADEPLSLEGDPGKSLWHLLRCPVTTREITESLTEAYGVDPTTVIAAIQPVLDHLARVGAVRLVAS